MEQQYVQPFLEGSGGPPLMHREGSQAAFLKDTQQWICSEEQVSADLVCLHPMLAMTCLSRFIQQRSLALFSQH